MEPLQNHEKFVSLPININIVIIALSSEQYRYNKLIDKNHKELVNILSGVILARMIQQQFNPSKESIIEYIIHALHKEEVPKEAVITKILQIYNAIKDHDTEIQVQDLLDCYDHHSSDYYEIETLTSILEESIYFQENSHENQQNPGNVLIKLADNILSDPNQMKNLEELVMKSQMILSEDCYASDVEETEQIIQQYLKLNAIKYPEKVEERKHIEQSANQTIKSLKNILNTSSANDVQSIIKNIQHAYLTMIYRLELPEFMHKTTQNFTFSAPHELYIENIEEFGTNCLNEILPIAMCYSPVELKTTIALLESQLDHPLEKKERILLPEFSKDPRTTQIRYMVELILVIYEHKSNIEILPPDESRFEDYNIYELFYEKEFAFTGKHIYVAMSKRNQGRN